MAMSERSMREVHDGTSCAVAACADLIGTKWTSLIIHDLSEGARRFTELEHACPGISPRTLSERLHMLELSGMVVRSSYPESPPRVEYELTPKGLALLPIIDYQRMSNLILVPAGGIASDGPTLTVRIFSRVPIPQIRSLACDPLKRRLSRPSVRPKSR